MNALTDSLNLFNQSFAQLELRLDAPAATLWAYMNPSPRPCYNETLLAECRALQGLLAATGGQLLHQSALRRVDYMVVGSRVPGVYNLGGDLAAFKALIETQDRERLFHYAKTCIDSLWACINRFDADVTLIALVQGKAMGGGFEGALPSDLIVAEESARFALPEVLFNLFPGMGALSLLSRKIGMRAAEEIIYSGKTYSAREMAALGVVDLVVPDGEGEHAVTEWIARRSRNAHARRLVQRAKQHVNRVPYKELLDVVNVWVDGALKLGERDLRVMDRLITAQSRRPEVTKQARAAA